MKRSLRPILFRLVAVGVPVLAGLILALGILVARQRLTVVRTGRITGLPRVEWQSGPIYLEEPGHDTTGHRYLYDERLGWRNIPNWRATTFGRPLTINSQGLRDREYSYAKPEGVWRVVVLGDSFTWGYGVADDEVFTEVLEHNLAERGTRCEVINTGVSGWGTDQEYLFLTDEGFKYEPDLVVVAFFLFNDPRNNSYSQQYGLRKPVFLNLDLELTGVPVPKPRTGPAEVATEADPLELTVAILERMQEECRQRNCRLVIMKFGRFIDPDSEDLAAQERAFQAGCAARIPGAAYFDLDQAFADHGALPERLVEGNHDGHWNAYGHRVTAELLGEFLQHEQLLPARTGD